MLFNSLKFMLFFLVVVLLYFIIPERMKKAWLLVSSYFFYMSWNIQYGALLAGVTLITYQGAIWIEKSGNIRVKKIYLILSIGAVLLILFFFKYFNFAINNLQAFLEMFGVVMPEKRFDVILPVGISFFTFQGIGYEADVYKGEKAERNLWEYALFLSFFPQLVAGPIERSKNLLGQLHEKSQFNYERLREGLLLMMWGYFLKLMIAGRAAIYVDTVYADFQLYPGIYSLIATILFAFQIYCDFAGYSTIAMGAAKILGIDLMDNFNCPYFSKSVAEFWNRWHISLGTWLRDYVYIPLGGNRKGIVRKYWNKIWVFLISGLWHGANWTFLAWGGVNAGYQIISEVLKNGNRTFNIGSRIKSSFGYKAFQIGITFLLIDFSWIFFRSESLNQAFRMIRQMFMHFNAEMILQKDFFSCGLDPVEFTILLASIFVLLFADLCKYHHLVIRHWILKQRCGFRWMAYLVIFYTIFIFGVWGEGYDAQSFIYFQF